METIQVVLDTKLLKAADQAAKRRRVNRSALIREALQDYLKRVRLREMEDQDRRGYERLPQQPTEYQPLEENSAWPEN